MTSPTSANKKAAGFTLVELLVVIGIILLLMGILIPTVIKALGAAQRARTSAELSSISTGLEQYHDDYGSYPMSAGDNTGAAVLGKALLALGPASDPVAVYSATADYYPGQLVSQSGTVYESIKGNPGPTNVAPPDTTYWQVSTALAAPMYSNSASYMPGAVINSNVSGTPQLYVCVVAAPLGTGPTGNSTDRYFVPFDWSDGGGSGQFRVRPGAPLKGAYLQPDKFKINGTEILDRNGNPILYTAASSSPHVLTTGIGYIAGGSLGGTLATSLFNVHDILINFRQNGEIDDSVSIQRVCAMLGDTNYDGRIDNGETPLAAGKPYLLWTAGADGLFGPNTTQITPISASQADDVTNFR